MNDLAKEKVGIVENFLRGVRPDGSLSERIWVDRGSCSMWTYSNSKTSTEVLRALVKYHGFEILEGTEGSLYHEGAALMVTAQSDVLVIHLLDEYVGQAS